MRSSVSSSQRPVQSSLKWARWLCMPTLASFWLNILNFCASEASYFTLYCNVYSQNPSLQAKQDTTPSYCQYIVYTTIADTYGTGAAQTLPLGEQKLRVAEAVYWLKLAFGNGALTLLVQSQWKKK